MTTIAIEELQRDWLNALQRVKTGESLLITEAGRPVAETKPPAVETRLPRPYGLAAGLFVVPEDFDEPLPADVLRTFKA
jgi:antitoxin (DNA-binding transcriptional repressor) of toxin-antitoxin stability system